MVYGELIYNGVYTDESYRIINNNNGDNSELVGELVRFVGEGEKKLFRAASRR